MESLNRETTQLKAIKADDKETALLLLSSVNKRHPIVIKYKNMHITAWINCHRNNQTFRCRIGRKSIASNTFDEIISYADHILTAMHPHE